MIAQLSDTLSDSDKLKIPGYELIRVDHASNQKRDGSCIYRKDFLPINVDLIFTSQPNLVMNSGVHSRHPNCHHPIIHAKFNWEIFYPPPYERAVSHYQDADNDLIQRSISQFKWERAFSNKCVNKQISIFDETILNIVTNFIPHEIKIFNDRAPPWKNNNVKAVIQEKNKIYQLHLKNKVVC